MVSQSYFFCFMVFSFDFFLIFFFFFLLYFFIFFLFFFYFFFFFFFQAEDGIRDPLVTGVQTCALPILTKKPDARRRLRLLLWGSTLTLTPVFLEVIRSFVLNQPRFENTPEWLILAVLLPLFFFPVILAYLIVVQRALDVRVVVRQSVQYLLARNTVRILQGAFM